MSPEHVASPPSLAKLGSPGATTFEFKGLPEST